MRRLGSVVRVRSTAWVFKPLLEFQNFSKTFNTLQFGAKMLKASTASPWVANFNIYLARTADICQTQTGLDAIEENVTPFHVFSVWMFPSTLLGLEYPTKQKVMYKG